MSSTLQTVAVTKLSLFPFVNPAKPSMFATIIIFSDKLWLKALNQFESETPEDVYVS